MTEIPDQQHTNLSAAVEDDYGVKVAVDAAVAACAPHVLPDSGRVMVTTPPGSSAFVLDIDAKYEKHAANPGRARGTFTAGDPDTLAWYTNLHGVKGSTEVWADVTSQSIVAILNAHQTHDFLVDDRGPLPGWGDHRAVFKAVLTDEWKTWINSNDKGMNQATFAEFIEDNLPNIVSPDPTTMLELVQTFDANASIVFKQQTRLASGERSLTYSEDIDARAGTTGQLVVPESFGIVLQPFEGSDRFTLTARLRFTLRDGALTLRYKLERPRDVMRSAFDDVVDKVRTGLADESVPVFTGVSASAQEPIVP